METDVPNRMLRRADELRNESARTLGRLVGVLRTRHEISRSSLAHRARLASVYVAISTLEQGLLEVDDLSRSRLRRLGRALGLGIHPDIFLAEASGIDYDQLPERARPIKLGIRITQ